MPQPNNSNNQNYSSTSNGSYSNFNGNLTLKNDRMSLNQHFYGMQSPSTAHTPGRKSASPHFFHSNESSFTKNSFDGQNQKHFNSSSHHISNNHNHNSNFNTHHQHNPCLGTSNNTSYQFSSSCNQENFNLKLPTTPTRSKSLSPSLRCVIQPPKIRYKQENTITSDQKSIEQLNGVKLPNRNPSNLSKDSLNKADVLYKNNIESNPYCFTPISTTQNAKNIKVKEMESEIKEIKSGENKKKSNPLSFKNDNLINNELNKDETIKNKSELRDDTQKLLNKSEKLDKNKSNEVEDESSKKTSKLALNNPDPMEKNTENDTISFVNF